jgi:hypothetical protein
MKRLTLNQILPKIIRITKPRAYEITLGFSYSRVNTIITPSGFKPTAQYRLDLKKWLRYILSNDLRPLLNWIEQRTIESVLPKIIKTTKQRLTI